MTDDKLATPDVKRTRKMAEHWDHILVSEFAKETDRGAAILAASLIDNALESLLRNYLVPHPGKEDDLFDGANAPLANFSSRITMCYRLGLVSQRLCRDLHLIRRIRNEFAHNIQGATFESTAIKSRIVELCRSHKICEQIPDIRKEQVPEGDRGDFMITVSWMIWILGERFEKGDRIEECGLEPGYPAQTAQKSA